MNKDEFIPQLILGYYRDMPAVMSDDVFEPSVSTPVITAAWMIAVLEAIERYLPDSEQINFEEEVNSAYIQLLEERHERTVHFKRKKDEGNY